MILVVLSTHAELASATARGGGASIVKRANSMVFSNSAAHTVMA